MPGVAKSLTRAGVLWCLVIAAIPGGGKAAAAPARPDGFDHHLHERDVLVDGGEAIACMRCHAMAKGMLVGRPEHAACFGSCHGAAPRSPADRVEHGRDQGRDRSVVCRACHAEAQLAAGRTGVAYPPYRLDPDFAITVGHRRHRDVACAQCHPGVPGQPSRQLVGPPHGRCAGCHDGSGSGHGPAMTACTGCHTPSVGAALPPALVRAEINARGAFSPAGHARHAARGAVGARCTTCHAAVQDTDDNSLPAPSAKTCATARCHDGTAFPITAACTRCHLDPKDPGFKVERPAARFSHSRHSAHASRDQAVTLPCASCHPLSRSGEVVTVGHAPCAGCHAEDFGRRQPTICGACHNGTEPWRPLVADRGPADRTEFGAMIDHARHDKLVGACTTCHALTTPASQLRPPRGHRACTGSACHAVASGPVPRLTACESCHQAGLASARASARLAAPWSVRAAFDHRAHAANAGASALACTACHTDLAAAEVTQLATPPKSTCAPCHDGSAAFKLTGTTCTRCHQGAK